MQEKKKNDEKVNNMINREKCGNKVINMKKKIKERKKM